MANFILEQRFQSIQSFIDNLANGGHTTAEIDGKLKELEGLEAQDAAQETALEVMRTNLQGERAKLSGDKQVLDANVAQLEADFKKYRDGRSVGDKIGGALGGIFGKKNKTSEDFKNKIGTAQKAVDAKAAEIGNKDTEINQKAGEIEEENHVIKADGFLMSRLQMASEGLDQTTARKMGKRAQVWLNDVDTATASGNQALKALSAAPNDSGARQSLDTTMKTLSGLIKALAAEQQNDTQVAGGFASQIGAFASQAKYDTERRAVSASRSGELARLEGEVNDQQRAEDRATASLKVLIVGQLAATNPTYAGTQNRLVDLQHYAALLQKVESSVGVLRDNVMTLTQAITAQGELDTALARNQQARESLSDQISDVERRGKTAADERDALADEVNRAKQQSNGLTADYDRMDVQYRQIIANLDDCKRQLAACETQQTGVQGELDAATQALNEAQQPTSGNVEHYITVLM